MEINIKKNACAIYIQKAGFAVRTTKMGIPKASSVIIISVGCFYMENINLFSIIAVNKVMVFHLFEPFCLQSSSDDACEIQFLSYFIGMKGLKRPVVFSFVNLQAFSYLAPRVFLSISINQLNFFYKCGRQ